MQLVALTPKTVLSHNIDLLISIPDGHTFLCFQFETGDGLTPVYSVSVRDTSFAALEKILALVDTLTFTLQQPTITAFRP